MRGARPLSAPARWPLALAAGTLLTAPSAADAHAGGTAFIQLLPTHLYIVGAAITVAVSFALVVLVPSGVFARAPELRWSLPPLRVPWAETLRTLVSLLSLTVLAALVVAGVQGSRDPLSNPLPLVVWTVWWVGFTYLHAALGDHWAYLNPWIGLHRLLTAAGPLGGWRERPLLRYPRAAGAWPALAGLAAFAWFELIYPAPMDPAILAGVVGGYVVAHLLGTLVFGPEWLGRAETFSVFFRTIASVAPVAWDVPKASAGRSAGDERAAGTSRLVIVPPTLGLLARPAPGASLVAFILLVLAAVSFDGLSRTFAWLGLIGVNPLLYPGRTELMLPNTLGLLGMFAVLSLAYLAAVTLGARLGGLQEPTVRLARVFAPALVPIVCGYHFAHYLPVFLVDVQYAARALSDPFARGWDLFGTRDLAVVTSFLTDASRIYAIWHTQVALVVGAHVAGVVVAHALAVQVADGGRAVVLGQLPLLLLMVGYTVLGLWLLSTPTVG